MSYEGIDRYIHQEMPEREYSENYSFPGIVIAGFPGQLVVDNDHYKQGAIMIILRALIIEVPGGVAGSFTITDNFKKVLLQLPYEPNVSGMYVMNHPIKSGRIRINCQFTVPGSPVNFIAQYQYIKLPTNKNR